MKLGANFCLLFVSVVLREPAIVVRGLFNDTNKFELWKCHVLDTMCQYISTSVSTFIWHNSFCWCSERKKIHKSWIIGFSQRFCQKRAVRFKRHNHASQLFAVEIRWSKQISGIELIYRFRKNHHCFVYLLIVQWISKMMKNLFACSVEHFKTYKYQIRDELHMQHNILCVMGFSPYR